jgi:hypothetical protein
MKVYREVGFRFVQCAKPPHKINRAIELLAGGGPGYGSVGEPLTFDYYRWATLPQFSYRG